MSWTCSRWCTGSPEVAADDLRDPAAWDVPTAPGYEWTTGPFNALTLLTRSDPGRVVVGPHPHCAGAPRPAPPELTTLTRMSTQPLDPESCLSWDTVDAYVADGRIRAITLDLWEP